MEEEEVTPPDTDFLPLSAGNRSRKLIVGKRTFVYGQTPASQQMALFDQMAATLGLSRLELAVSLTTTNDSFEQRLACIRRCCERENSPKQVLSLLDEVLTAHVDEQREILLRRISYNQPLASTLAHPPAKKSFARKRKADGSVSKSASLIDRHREAISRPSPSDSSRRMNVDGADHLFFQAEDDAALANLTRDSAEDDAALANLTRASAEDDGALANLTRDSAEDDAALVNLTRDSPLLLSDSSAASVHSAPNLSSVVSKPEADNEKEVDEDDLGGWSLVTKPAPAGQIYRRHRCSREDDDGLDNQPTTTAVVKKIVEKVPVLFDDSDDECLDFKEIFDEFSRRKSSPAPKTPIFRQFSPKGENCDGSDLLDEIFS
jgi:hypothetical protein